MPIPLARRLANAAPWFERAGRAVAADRLHVTLFILPDCFDRSEPLIKRLRTVGAEVALPPVEVLLDYVSGGGRSIALRPQRRIAERPDYDFQPHVTLGYRDGRPFGERVRPVGWTATEFVLLHSHLGHIRHTELGRWPLAGTDPQGSLF